MHQNIIKIAVIDLNNGAPNQGLRCLRELLQQADQNRPGIVVAFDFFDTRHGGELPDITYDIFISSGGPGSPYDGEGLAWEKNYFNLVDRIYAHNQNCNPRKKYIFFICHSFQMMVRFFGIAEVIRRHSKAFGIFPVHKTEDGRADIINICVMYYRVSSTGFCIDLSNLARSKWVISTEITNVH